MHPELLICLAANNSGSELIRVSLVTGDADTGLPVVANWVTPYSAACPAGDPETLENLLYCSMLRARTQNPTHGPCFSIIAFVYVPPETIHY